ncbi:MAG: response regulator transcription factor [Oscillospiraceae bacterium]|nr:response regulator transcription factor [Oscillospiraceae bacterium]
MKQIIFAVEDDAAIQELYTYSLENDFDCHCFDNGNSFFDALSKGIQDPFIIPDLILLDIMLPGDDGYTILSRLKTNKLTSHIPVIMVSAKGEEISKVKGLNMGADDYLSKPFGILELLARIKANLRKNNKSNRTANENDNIVYKDIVIDFTKHSITANGAQIQTTLKEYNLLCLLCENAGKVQERENIFSEVWKNDYIGETRTLDIHVKELRKKLSEAESKVVIQTIRGVGYMLS